MVDTTDLILVGGVGLGALYILTGNEVDPRVDQAFDNIERLQGLLTEEQQRSPDIPDQTVEEHIAIAEASLQDANAEARDLDIEEATRSPENITAEAQGEGREAVAASLKLAAVDVWGAVGEKAAEESGDLSWAARVADLLPFMQTLLKISPFADDETLVVVGLGLLACWRTNGCPTNQMSTLAEWARNGVVKGRQFYNRDPQEESQAVSDLRPLPEPDPLPDPSPGETVTVEASAAGNILPDDVLGDLLAAASIPATAAITVSSEALDLLTDAVEASRSELVNNPALLAVVVILALAVASVAGVPIVGGSAASAVIAAAARFIGTRIVSKQALKQAGRAAAV